MQIKLIFRRKVLHLRTRKRPIHHFQLKQKKLLAIIIIIIYFFLTTFYYHYQYYNYYVHSL